MRHLVTALVFALFAAGAAAQESTGGGSAELAKMKNPVAATPESIAAGQTIYVRRCSGCHGKEGTGGFLGSPDLTDGEWKLGATDGEIFHVILKGGGPDSRMEPFEDRLNENDAWNVVNYLRSIAKK
jgi:mono/diheme cytochrome c family protein